jgi:MATE family multidrug resistance protein
VHLGPIVVAGHQVANNYSALVFMLPLSLGMSVVIRSGHLIGLKAVHELKVVASTAIILGILISIISATFTFLFREQIASLYTKNDEVIVLASSLLLLACIYQITDSVQVICGSFLRGMKITKPTFYITLIAYWPLGFGLGYLLSLTDFIVPAMGVHGFWIGIIIGLSSAAIMLSFVLRRELKSIEETDNWRF